MTSILIVRCPRPPSASQLLLEARITLGFAVRELQYQRWIFRLQHRAGTVYRFRTMQRIRAAKTRVRREARALETLIYGPQGRTRNAPSTES